MEPLAVAAVSAAVIVAVAAITILASAWSIVKSIQVVVMALLLAGFVAAAIIMAADITALRDTMLPQPKLFLLKMNDTLMGGIVTNGTPTRVCSLPCIYAAPAFEDVIPLADITAYQERWRAGGVAAVHSGVNHTVFVMDESTLEGTESILLLNHTIDRSMAIAYLLNDTPRNAFMGWLMEEDDVPQEFRAGLESQFERFAPTEDYFRGVLFAKLAAENIRGTGWMEVYRSGHAEMYPQSITINILKSVPEDILRFVLVTGE